MLFDTAEIAGIEPRATHRKPKRRYKTRMRMPSKLDPHLATIEIWLAAEPDITALSIVGRLARIEPATFGDKQKSIVQRLLRSLRRRMAETALFAPEPPGAVDGRCESIALRIAHSPSCRASCNKRFTAN